jgi:hypothetical protein
MNVAPDPDADKGVEKTTQVGTTAVVPASHPPGGM